MHFRGLAVGLVLLLAGCSGSNMDVRTNGQGGGAGQGGGQGGPFVQGSEDCDNQVDDDGDSLVDCADDACFQAPSCFASCVDTCTDGAAICDAAGVRTCQLQAGGCRAFGPAVGCPGGLLCSGGQCVASCQDQCTQGALQCSSTGGVVECKKLPSGCTDWVGPQGCNTGNVCSGGQCVPQAQCQNQCSQGTTRCTATGQVQTCVQLSSGCTDWTFPVSCGSGQSCSAATNACAAAPKCTQGDVRCATAVPAVETCDASGAWVTSQSCAQACFQGACTAAAACTAGAVRCNGLSVEVCNSSGSAWLFSQACNVACNGGVCADPCTPGAKRCNAKTPETCNAAGSAWTPAAACATDCYGGACIAADLVVDGVTQTLEGDLKFQNSVIVRNGGQLKVGPSGQLTIRAKSIHVDAASNINANGVGDDQAPVTTVSVFSHCHDGYLCCSGGYDRTVSVDCVGSAQPSACTGGNPCSSVSPVATGRADDVFVNEGSKYGSSLGGGAVRLIAESIDVKGQITANASGSYAYGGGVLLAADTISGSGAVQATGYYPGYVKVLKGTTDSFSGSITGNSVKSVLPPLDLVSGSHPDQSRVYNDGLGDLFVAWSRPFPTVNGYYFKVSQSESALPSQAAGQGTYLQAESYKVKADDLQPGTNYFHLVSVDSTFNVGKVKSFFKVTVNATPPDVRSSSHPSQSTWYANNAVYLSWTDPEDSLNFTGYYYVLDQYADTVPTANPAQFTDLRQMLRANLPDGIWVFHLVSRDTRGALTKEAEHYQLRIGTEPAKENISGSVFDASNSSAPLSGVTLSINRGLFNATSTSSGTYTFNGNLYVGTWEVTAKKDGYLPQTKTVTLVKGSPLNENFTLQKKP